MKRCSALPAVVALAVMSGCSRASDDAHAASAGVVALAPEQFVWQRVAGGALRTVLYGDPSSKGYYALRFKLPPHWEAAPHVHLSAMIVTIRSGTMYFAFGEDLSREAAKAFGPGSFIAFPAGTPMREFVGGEDVVVDLQGQGPLKTHGLTEQGGKWR